MLFIYDIAIIGSGIIGTSISRELSRFKLNICLLDKNSDIGEGTTKANSAIIHAGFDASPSSLKGKLNAKGNSAFDNLSKELDFPFKRIGALVLALASQERTFEAEKLTKLEELKAQGIKNGVPHLEILSGAEAMKLVPSLNDSIYAALYAPSSGIVCPFEMALAMAENANDNGVEFFFNSKVKSIIKADNIFTIKTENSEYRAKVVINAAGVYADEINNMISEHKQAIIPRKGEYLIFDKDCGKLTDMTLFQLPTIMGKGVLITPTIHGNLIVGPNALDISDKADTTTTSSAISYVIRKAGLTIRALPMKSVITSFAGLRAHSQGDDFIIEEAKDVPGFINVSAIESPGLSSAPAIADMVVDLARNSLDLIKKESFNPKRQGIIKFMELNKAEKQMLIKKDPSYGRVICRCETVTEGEILASIRRPLGARTIDGVKRRTRAGMGRCQGGFCSSKILWILSKELNLLPEEVTKFGMKSFILLGKNKKV